MKVAKCLLAEHIDQVSKFDGPTRTFSPRCMYERRYKFVSRLKFQLIFSYCKLIENNESALDRGKFANIVDW